MFQITDQSATWADLRNSKLFPPTPVPAGRHDNARYPLGRPQALTRGRGARHPDPSALRGPLRPLLMQREQWYRFPDPEEFGHFNSVGPLFERSGRKIGGRPLRQKSLRDDAILHSFAAAQGRSSGLDEASQQT